MKVSRSVAAIIISMVISLACAEPEPRPTKTNAKTEADYIKPIPGKSDTIPTEIINRGEVLIAYSDCHTCHTLEERFKGPSFKDIAKRYPVNNSYIELLAQRIILGGSGAWGYSVMSAHPDLSPDDAKMMVKYILSLKE